MQLDKTRIAIRERSYLDILDLALHVLRMHPVALPLALVAGMLPIALFNAWMLSDTWTPAELDTEYFWDYVFNEYSFNLVWLTIWEMPLAGALATLLLGQALFVERPSAARLVREFLGSLPHLIVVEVLLRGILTLFIITIPVMYIVWPFAGEVILLERNPLRRRNPQAATTLGRAVGMHSGLMGEVIGRWMLAVVLGTVLVFVVWLGFGYLYFGFTLQAFDEAMYRIWLPLSLWVVIGYFTVVRFLSYLDVRIRTEGWEVELAVRAEATRLIRQLT